MKDQKPRQPSPDEVLQRMLNTPHVPHVGTRKKAQPKPFKAPKKK